MFLFLPGALALVTYFHGPPFSSFGLVFLVVSVLVFVSLMRKTRLDLKDIRQGQPHPAQILIDDKSVVHEAAGVRITMEVENIVELTEFKGCMTLKSAAGNLIGLPIDQLLEHEQNVLDGVRGRILQHQEEMR